MLAKLRPVLIVTRREVRDQFRDWRITLPVISLTVFFPWLLNLTARQVTNFMKSYNAAIISDRLVPFLLLMVGFFPVTVALVIALESFAGEKERRSIEPLLSSPLEDWQLFLGKLFASLVTPVLASYLGTVVYLVGIARTIGWQPPVELFLQILAMTFVQPLVMVSAAVVVSTQTTSVRAANLLASFIVIPMVLLIEGESVLMFWADYDVIWWLILGQALLGGLLARMGLSYFNREELLGRELDAINLRWSWQVFKRGIVGEARSVGDWYRKEVAAALRRLRLPAALVIGIFIVSILIGWMETENFPLPGAALSPESVAKSLQGGLSNLPLFSAGTVPIIWLHNLRAMALATLLGMVSFGVAGVLVLMLPLLIIGFLMGVAVQSGFSPWVFLAAFIAPHGILEIPALILMGASILRLGATFVTPSQGKTIGHVGLLALADWTKIFIALVVPLLLGAAFLEVLVTPRLAQLILGG